MEPLLPFPVAPVSNGEWCPLPITDIQRLAARRIVEETARRAKRLGMTRAQFLRTAAGTATAFMVLSEVWGRDAWGDAAVLPVRREHCDDPAAGRALLDRKYFVMDVQTHHVDLHLPNPEQWCGLRFLETQLSCAERTQHLGQLNFVKELFVDSETDVGVISGVPAGILLGPDGMAATRDFVNGLAGSERALSQVVCDPTFPASAPTSIASIERQVKELGGKALKCYTYSGAWWLDSDVGFRMIDEARRHGIRLVNVHKGLPNQLVQHSEEYVRTTDIPGAVRQFPDVKFCAYHSGYFQTAAENGEFLSILEQMSKKERRRVYAEIGSSFAITLLFGGPDGAAHFIGRLLKVLGPRNILWGTDSIWWGSPQFLIDAFKTMQIPGDLREKYGYPQLTEKVKRRILGLNAAKLYGVDPRERRCTLAADRLAQVQAEQGGHRAGRTFRTYGPRTRREFLAFWRREQAGLG